MGNEPNMQKIVVTAMISKSDYMLFLRHPAWLWLKKNDPSKLPAVDAATQAMFDAGHAFEPYVESLFPEGVTLGFSDFDEYRTRVKPDHRQARACS